MPLETPELNTLHVMESTLIDLSAWQFLRCPQEKAHRGSTCRQSQCASAPCCRRHDTKTKFYYLHQAPVRIEPLLYHRSISPWDGSWRRYLPNKTQCFSNHCAVQLLKKYVLQFLPGRPEKSKFPQNLNQHRDSNISALALGWNLLMKKQLA